MNFKFVEKSWGVLDLCMKWVRWWLRHTFLHFCVDEHLDPSLRNDFSSSFFNKKLDKLTRSLFKTRSFAKKKTIACCDLSTSIGCNLHPKVRKRFNTWFFQSFHISTPTLSNKYLKISNLLNRYRTELATSSQSFFHATIFRARNKYLLVQTFDWLKLVSSVYN